MVPLDDVNPEASNLSEKDESSPALLVFIARNPVLDHVQSLHILSQSSTFTYSGDDTSYTVSDSGK